MTKDIAVFKRGIGVPFIYGAAVVLAGCTAATPPVDTISTADTAVNRALEAQAMQRAPLELRPAMEKLEAAKQASEEEDYEEARRLAEQARVDARLAEAKARSESVRQEAQELQQAVETLHHEINRETNQ